MGRSARAAKAARGKARAVLEHTCRHCAGAARWRTGCSTPRGIYPVAARGSAPLATEWPVEQGRWATVGSAVRKDRAGECRRPAHGGREAKGTALRRILLDMHGPGSSL